MPGWDGIVFRRERSFCWLQLGGALGVWIAMYRKRHKTRHLSFKIGVPLLLIVNVALYTYFWG
ncbi:hypothetical protein PVOR_06975 [Paenibacillus vortex V453]|uniref:DUF1294 domain-containing protein n=1 Tax=Paenibacillus vortex V453 TaxID=715225 RepID=A0A2R9SYW4_9BACL|nr:hypothetical protein PVOR_06975 [Paenibacillus vortex V453]